MKISIITISFNSAETIEDTIRSVFSQDYPDIEYIVVDGASGDGTVSIIRKYEQQISKFVSEKDHGIYDAMNKGLSMATGEVIGILNSDDVYSGPGVIGSVMKMFEESGAEGVYGDLVYVSKDLNRVVRYWKSGAYKEGLFLKGWMPPHPAFFVKRDVYERLGNFNLQLKSSADYELMLRFIHKERISLCYLPEVLVKMRTGGQSNISLKNRILANQEDRLAWRVNGLQPGFFTLYLKPLRKIKQYLIR